MNFHQISCPFHDTLWCDNESLVNEIKKFRKSSSTAAVLGHPLRSEWDTLNQISQSLQQLQQTFPIRWIRGHQDDTTAFEDLPIKAQLNVHADHLAARYHMEHDIDTTVVPITEANVVLFDMPQGTITAKIQSKIRYAFSSLTILSAMKTKYDWDDTILDYIDWRAHSSAINRHPKQRLSTVKLCHEMVPTNYFVSKYDPSRSPNCPHCKHVPETRDHLLRCPHYQQWRTSCLITIHKVTDKLHTQPMLQEILLKGLLTWFENKYFNPDQYDHRYRKLLSQQASIGWRQLFNGRLSSEWQRLQED